MNVAQNTAATQAAALVGAFTNGSILKLYSGTIPATPETAIGAQVLLATLTLPVTAAFTQAAGVMTAAAITPQNIAVTGTCSFARWLKADGTTVIADMTVGTTGTDIIVPTTAFVASVLLGVTSMTYTIPSS